MSGGYSPLRRWLRTERTRDLNRVCNEWQRDRDFAERGYTYVWRSFHVVGYTADGFPLAWGIASVDIAPVPPDGEPLNPSPDHPIERMTDPDYRALRPKAGE